MCLSLRTRVGSLRPLFCLPSFARRLFLARRPQAAGKYTRIFTYAFGDGSETASLKSIACQNGGVFHRIMDRCGARARCSIAGLPVLRPPWKMVGNRRALLLCSVCFAAFVLLLCVRFADLQRSLLCIVAAFAVLLCSVAA